MRSERLCSLGRHLQNLPKDALDTYSAQWFERTLVSLSLHVVRDETDTNYTTGRQCHSSNQSSRAVLVCRCLLDPAQYVIQCYYISTYDEKALTYLTDNVTSGFVVYPEVIKRRVQEELPFMATENVLYPRPLIPKQYNMLIRQ